HGLARLDANRVLGEARRRQVHFVRLAPRRQLGAERGGRRDGGGGRAGGEAGKHDEQQYSAVGRKQLLHRWPFLRRLGSRGYYSTARGLRIPSPRKRAARAYRQLFWLQRDGIGYWTVTVRFMFGWIEQ